MAEASHGGALGTLYDFAEGNGHEKSRIDEIVQDAAQQTEWEDKNRRHACYRALAVLAGAVHHPGVTCPREAGRVAHGR